MSNMDKYMYPAEKFSAARRILMAPHPKGEAKSFSSAYHECYLGLKNLKPEDLDDNARSWISTINRLMDTSGIVDPQGRGTAIIKAEKLTIDEKVEFSNAVDELAHWFDRRSLGHK